MLLTISQPFIYMSCMHFREEVLLDVSRMQANADKFQVILFGRHEIAGSLHIGGTVISSDSCNTVVFFSYDTVVPAQRYVNVLSRITNALLSIFVQSIFVQVFQPLFVLGYGVFVD